MAPKPTPSPVPAAPGAVPQPPPEFGVDYDEIAKVSSMWSGAADTISELAFSAAPAVVCDQIRRNTPHVLPMSVISTPWTQGLTPCSARQVTVHHESEALNPTGPLSETFGHGSLPYGIALKRSEVLK